MKTKFDLTQLKDNSDRTTCTVSVYRTPSGKWTFQGTDQSAQNDDPKSTKRQKMDNGVSDINLYGGPEPPLR